MGRRPAVFNKDWPDFSVLHYRRHMISRILGLVALAALIAGCNRAVDQRGNLPETGADGRNQTRRDHQGPGQPRYWDAIEYVGVFDDLNWYYISKRTKQVAFFDPDVLDQQVM